MTPDPSPWTPAVGDRVRVRLTGWTGIVWGLYGDAASVRLDPVHTAAAGWGFIAPLSNLAPLDDADTPVIVNG